VRRSRIALVALLAALPARAMAGEAIDDPKLERRLGTRVDTPPPVAAPAPAPRPPAAAAPETAAVPAAAPAGPVETLSRRAGSSEEASREPSTPRVKLGFRRFDFVRIGASDAGSTSGTASSEPFNSVSLDFYPVSSLVRFGLTTQYGWQSGAIQANGDYFLAQSFSLGAQLARKQLVPFVEAFAGAGYMRRVQFQRTVPTVYWQMGVDAGTEIFVGQHVFLSLAVGYLHPVTGFESAQTMGSTTTNQFTSVFVDTWSFKLGIGL
jgi:hypothetical protein